MPDEAHHVPAETVQNVKLNRWFSHSWPSCWSVGNRPVAHSLNRNAFLLCFVTFLLFFPYLPIPPYIIPSPFLSTRNGLCNPAGGPGECYKLPHGTPCTKTHFPCIHVFTAQRKRVTGGCKCRSISVERNLKNEASVPLLNSTSSCLKNLFRCVLTLETATRKILFGEKVLYGNAHINIQRHGGGLKLVAPV